MLGHQRCLYVSLTMCVCVCVPCRGVCGPGSEQSVGPTAPTEASSDYGSGQYNSQSMRQASGVNSHSRRTSSRAGSHISGPASHNACVSPADSNVCVRARRGSAYGEGQRSSL